MSTITAPQTDQPPKLPAHYRERAREGDVTWLEDAIADYLGIAVTEAQCEICRAVVGNPKVLVITANGLGKSYILAAITVVWLSVFFPAVVFATSGTERKMRRTYCKPVESLHGNARIALPGRYKHQPPRIEVDGEPEHFFEASSPGDAGELEGVHSAHTLAIVEEADKERVDKDVIDSMDSLVTDMQDRFIAVANPPKSEVNVVSDMIASGEWKKVQLSSFDSHNVQVELNAADPYDAEGALREDVREQMIDGIATLWKIRKDWETYNNAPWPGAEEAQSTVYRDPDTGLLHAARDDLDVRWYRRRLGVIPPQSASEHRPIYVQDVEAAFERGTDPEKRAQLRTRETPEAAGLDVARSGDQTVMIGKHMDLLEVEYAEQGTHHTLQKTELAQKLQPWPPLPLAGDANGEGSGVIDELDARFSQVTRFKNGRNAVDEHTYKDAWTEGLALLGKFLRNGGAFSDRRLREQLLACARAVEYDARYIGSRDDEVYVATAKDAVTTELGGESPDHLDAALMCIHAFEHPDGISGKPKSRFRFV